MSPLPLQRTFEIIVVDNGSLDNTAAVVSSLNISGLRYVYEAAPGLSCARNTGWQAAQGKYVAFLDDDAQAYPGWIDAIADGFAQDAGAGALGGPVQPYWHAERPHWLTDEVGHSLTILDWGNEAHRLDPDRQWLVGANIAFRRDLLEICGGFDRRLGRQGDLLLSNEETFLMRQITKVGYGALYWPSMRVMHPVPVARLDPRWLIQRHFWQGISDARVRLLDHSDHDSSAQLLHSADALQLPEADFSADLNGPNFTRQCRAARQAGYVTGLLSGAGL